MADEITIPLAAIGGSSGVLSLVGGWFLRSHNERIKKIEADNKERLQKIEDENKVNAVAVQSVATNLAAYQLDSEKRFAKEESVQQSLARLHERIDSTATKDDLKELKSDVGGLRDDIKILIGRAGAA
jgi:hypothetical protein